MEPTNMLMDMHVEYKDAFQEEHGSVLDFMARFVETNTIWEFFFIIWKKSIILTYIVHSKS
jgi:hypothetical protein